MFIELTGTGKNKLIVNAKEIQAIEPSLIYIDSGHKKCSKIHFNKKSVVALETCSEVMDILQRSSK